MGHNETEGTTGCPSTSFGHPQSPTYRCINTQKKKQGRQSAILLFIDLCLSLSQYLLKESMFVILRNRLLEENK